MNYIEKGEHTWQMHEDQGDQYWDGAFRAETFEERQDLLRLASSSYEKALEDLEPESQEVLSVARLHRKLAGCHRKIGREDLELARSHLDRARKFVRAFLVKAEGLLENARIDLEFAYCDFVNGDFKTLQDKAEDIIIEYGEEIQACPKGACILGQAYNLLGIGLDMHSETSTKLGMDAQQSWVEAKQFCQSVDLVEAQAVLQDAVINLAESHRLAGHCDLTVEMLEGALEMPLFPGRLKRARNNLIANYLDRMDKDDLDRVITLTEEAVRHAETYHNDATLIWAIEARLRAIVEELCVSDQPWTLLNDKALPLYWKSRKSIKSSASGEAEDSSDLYELQRIMTEVYLAAGEIEKAIEEFEKIPLPTGSNWETEDYYLTRALYLQHKSPQDWGGAGEALETARKFFHRVQSWGMVIETDMRRAELLAKYGVWSEAQELLIDAGELAAEHHLQCRARLDRLEALRSRVESAITMLSKPITWLHLSDLHFKASPSYNANVVLDELLKDVTARVEKVSLKPDFIVVTGDVTFSGKPAEYELAVDFFDRLLEITGLSKARLFVVPGNHDVDRARVSPGAKIIGKYIDNRDMTNSVLASVSDRGLMLRRFEGYADFMNKHLKHLTFSEEIYYVHPVELSEWRIALLGLNSAWISCSNRDEEEGLLLGERQVRDALKEAEKVNPTLTIALLHHPLRLLRDFDRSDCEALLLDNCDFVLHGHEHQLSTMRLECPDSSAMVIAGGASYKERSYANKYNFVQLNFLNRKGTIHLRRYSDERGGFWTEDALTYKNVTDGTYSFELPQSLFEFLKPILEEGS